MKRLFYLAGIAVAIAAMPAGVLRSSPVDVPMIAASATLTQAPLTQGKVQPEAIAAVQKMGTYLRSLRAFQVSAVTTTDDVLDDGQKVQVAGVIDLLAQSPNRLRAEVTTDRRSRMFFYDGKNFTLWARRLNYYATVPAPATSAELISQLEAKFYIEFPLVDLFRWGGAQAAPGVIKSASDIGPSQVEGTTCEQYAFRQEGLDWQVWIQQGAFPLPRKLVLTTTSDDARPEFSSVYTWNLAPSFNDAAFTFVPPKDAWKITFAEAGTGGRGR